MWQTALLGAVQTGTAPAQQVDIQSYYGSAETEKTDNTILYIIVIAAVLIGAGTIYFITR